MDLLHSERLILVMPATNALSERSFMTYHDAKKANVSIQGRRAQLKSNLQNLIKYKYLLYISVLFWSRLCPFTQGKKKGNGRAGREKGKNASEVLTSLFAFGLLLSPQLMICLLLIWPGGRAQGLRQSCPLTFKFVPTGLRA